LAAINVSSVTANGYSFQIELTHRIWRRGLKIAEVPIIFTDREQGVSKMSRDIAIEAAWMVWRLLLENRFRRQPDTTSH
jgi:dolichol-phosphate mannosyltransferase